MISPINSRSRGLTKDAFIRSDNNVCLCGHCPLVSSQWHVFYKEEGHYFKVKNNL